MHKVGGILRRVYLHDPVDATHVNPARCHVGAKQGQTVVIVVVVVVILLSKSFERLFATFLHHFSVQQFNRNFVAIERLKGIAKKINGRAGKKKDNDFFLRVLRQKCLEPG